MINIEISYTTDDEDFPEHYGYYDNAEDAKRAIDEIIEIVESEWQYDAGGINYSDYMRYDSVYLHSW